MQTELYYLLQVLENYKYPLHTITVKMLIGFIKESHELVENDQYRINDFIGEDFFD
jgi:hypothetical protein